MHQTQQNSWNHNPMGLIIGQLNSADTGNLDLHDAIYGWLRSKLWLINNQGKLHVIIRNNTAWFEVLRSSLLLNNH